MVHSCSLPTICSEFRLLGSFLPWTRADRSRRVEQDYTPGTDLVMQVMTVTYPDLADGQRVAADRVMKTLKAMHAEQPLLARKLVTCASGGGETEARAGSIAWHFQKLEERGVLIKPLKGLLYVQNENEARPLLV